MNPTIIGLGGYAKAGKDAVAGALCRDPSWRRDYMSRPLEQALLTLDPFVNVRWRNWEDHTYDVEKFRYSNFIRYSELHERVGYDQSKNCFDVRVYLQLLGTEIGRKMFGENVWVDYAMRSVGEMTEAGYNVALTGIRFPNEIEALRNIGGIAVWVRRPGYGPVNEHTSDNALSERDFDLILENNGSLDDLEEIVFGTVVPRLANRGTEQLAA